MRKITREIADAFNAGEAKSRASGNGATWTDGDTIWLHGNKIVERRPDGIYVCDGGWGSTTTKERLKPFVQAYTHKHDLHISIAGGDGRPWDGSWVYAGADESDLTPQQRLQTLANRIRARVEAGAEHLQEAYSEALDAAAA